MSFESLFQQFSDPNAYLRFTNAVQPPAAQFLLMMFLAWYVEVSVREGWRKTAKWLIGMVFNTTGGSFAIGFCANLVGSWVAANAIAEWRDTGAAMGAFPWAAVTIGRTMIFASYLCIVRILAPHDYRNYYWLACALYSIWYAVTPRYVPTTIFSTAIIAGFIIFAVWLWHDRHRVYRFFAKRFGRGARVHFSEDGRFYYCTVADRPGDTPRHWFEVTTSMCPVEDVAPDTFEPIWIEMSVHGERYCRRAFPFTFFRAPEGRIEALSDTNRHLFNDYAAYHGWAPYPESTNG